MMESLENRPSDDGTDALCASAVGSVLSNDKWVRILLQHELRTLELADATILAKSRSLADPGFYGLPGPLLSSYADSQIQGFE